MNRYVSLLLFVVLVLGGGTLLGLISEPDSWYAALRKPPFNPPGWVFGPVWSVLYVMIAIAGWRIWTGERDATLMKLWWLQLALNFAWTPIFFGAHQIALALVVVAALVVVNVLFVRRAWSRDRVAALLFVPYLAWTSFATLLTASILVLN